MTITRNPMSLCHEVIRQGRKNLHVVAHSQGQALDMLIGAGAVSIVEIAYGGTARFSPGGGPCFKRAIEKGRIKFEDYSNFQISLRFLAGAMGIPFMPLHASLETDLVKRWGISASERRKNEKLPIKKLDVIENPFARGEAENLIAVPALNPDVTMIHAHQADAEGTVRIKGLTFTDVEQVKASKHVIVSCEELVEPGFLREDPMQNQIPFFMVDAVVPMPYGAHPTACYGYYDYDPVHLKLYAEKARHEASLKEYLTTFVYGTRDHVEYLSQVGEEALARIKADPETGYTPGLDRSGE
ncbi:MAG: CoA transferase subunit A [Deltaproteobacteria bacterium]|nr:MAG: CoA transferase subunit A [Deltaproteobacteria bacterium]